MWWPQKWWIQGCACVYVSQFFYLGSLSSLSSCCCCCCCLYSVTMREPEWIRLVWSHVGGFLAPLQLPSENLTSPEHLIFWWRWQWIIVYSVPWPSEMSTSDYVVIMAQTLYTRLENFKIKPYGDRLSERASSGRLRNCSFHHLSVIADWEGIHMN